MKAALLNDFETYAGAETAIKQRLALKPKNIECDFITPGKIIEFEKYDGFILENIVKFPEPILLNVLKYPFIKVEHDFNFCHYRNQIQCNACDLPCPIQVNPLIKNVYEKAKLVICASPAHAQIHQQLLKDWKVNLVYGLPYAHSTPTLPKVKRKPKTVAYLGTMRKFKGIYDIIALAKRLPQYHFDLAGRHGCIKGEMPKNVAYLGEIPDKWEYLAQHEYFIHVPQHLDPCPGTVIEAILAGCKIIFNANVGTLSYQYHTKKDWEEALKQAAPVFWKRVTDSFNNNKKN